MSQEYLSRNVKRETEEHYKNRWPFAADARRNLYLKYAREIPKDIAVLPGLNNPETDSPFDRGPRDIWKEISKDILEYSGNGDHMQGLDVGASSGYFIQKMLEEGYRGRLIGVDIEMETQDVVETIVRSDFPEANIMLGGSDAQKLEKIEFFDEAGNKREEKIPDDYFDFLTELFVLYHVPNVKKAYNAAHRVVKPGGVVVFSGRHELNQRHLWSLGGVIAARFGVKAPESFYSHHNLAAIEQHLESSPKYELINSVSQSENLWIPNTEESWMDYKWALMTLPYGKIPGTNRAISGESMEDFIETDIRPMFESQASGNGTDGKYFLDYVWQNYYVCRAVK